MRDYESILSDMDAMKHRDPQDMLGLIEGLPEQFEEALDIAVNADLPDWPLPANVVVLGMGGSAVGGDLVKALLEPTCPIPMAVNRGYDIPGYVGKNTVVVASSYSGNTEETLSGYAQAKAKGAQIICITTGGKLADAARADGCPFVEIPGGLQPRAAIGYSFVPLMIALSRLGLGPDPQADIQETITVMRKQRQRLGREASPADNLSKQIALKLLDKIPLIYGSYGYKGVAAYRWKTQFNENSKAPAVWNVFPELNHNETVGWEAPADRLKEIQIIVLRDKADPEKIRTRVDVTEEIVGRTAAGVTDVWTEGQSDLAKLFSVIYVGDFVTGYVALLHDIDPTPVKMIDYLKSELAKAGARA